MQSIFINYPAAERAASKLPQGTNFKVLKVFRRGQLLGYSVFYNGGFIIE